MNIQDIANSLVSLAEQVAADNNELSSRINAVGTALSNLIQDQETESSTATWSIDQINAAIQTAVSGTLTPEQLQALLALVTAINADGDLFSHLVNAMSRMVSFDPLADGTTITEEDKSAARSNIGAIGLQQLEEATTFSGQDPVAIYRQIRGL